MVCLAVFDLKLSVNVRIIIEGQRGVTLSRHDPVSSYFQLAIFIALCLTILSTRRAGARHVRDRGLRCRWAWMGGCENEEMGRSRGDGDGGM